MDLKIDSHYITLGDFLKFFGLAATGGEAKTIVKSGGVLVNREVCMMRGKKLTKGDTVEYDGHTYTIKESK
jgi:ribosome-associated protein